MPENDHPHDHDHPHASIENSERPGYYEILEIAIRELLTEKGLISADQHRRQIEILDSRTPALGAKVVARAWVDPDFKQRLLCNASPAVEALGIGMYDDTKLIVIENTDTVHNMIVCTLCSCYPRPILGLPPDGIRASNTEPAPSANRVPCSQSLAHLFPPRRKSGSTTQQQTCAT